MARAQDHRLLIDLFEGEAKKIWGAADFLAQETLDPGVIESVWPLGVLRSRSSRTTMSVACPSA